jgi:hypothetical protein
VGPAVPLVIARSTQPLVGFIKYRMQFPTVNWDVYSAVVAKGKKIINLVLPYMTVDVV